MQNLFLTREQARRLGSDLVEYCEIRDSNDRDLFKGFQIRFDDLFADSPQPGCWLEVHPIPEQLEISDDTGE